MNRMPLEGLVILLVWAALILAYSQMGTHKRITRNASEKAPVVRSTRLPFRFTTRSLLILTTCVAVVLGLIMWAAAP